jgi:hypothetical protein
MQLRGELHQPRQSVWPLERDATLGLQVRHFDDNVLRRQAASQRGACSLGEGLIRIQTHRTHQQPVPVHRGVPVVTAKECRRQLPRRLRIGVAAHDVRDLVGILAMHTFEREAGETHRRFDVQVLRVRGGAVEQGHRKNYPTSHRFTIA